jgi:hypothetical protein
LPIDPAVRSETRPNNFSIFYCSDHLNLHITLLLSSSLSVDKTDGPHCEMSDERNHIYLIGCKPSQFVQCREEIMNCKMNARMVSISIEICFQWSGQVRNRYLLNSVDVTDLRKHLSRKGARKMLSEIRWISKSSILRSGRSVIDNGSTTAWQHDNAT